MSKPTIEELGIDPGTLDWKRSQTTEGGIEVAFVGEWTFLRTSGDLISVFDENEWACFLDGVKNGEFDHAAS
ncbi:DUF397 domain-containing protein [Actinomadura darangshiensis]|uniref:DUF397 domain-containing protein n=1 Tax=Actinomadura darangshiensis TaxID=705336 RepID=A0A4R5ALI3_9ACTN|nr:DUF397 domain-containing protein [Actinomadura darangshiensis]TDD72775.1 DUF397 domain-containing protein [Actinomadura darangshiensis]